MNWNEYFNKPDKPVIDEWQKMFKPDNKSGSAFRLDEKTCAAAKIFYGPDHELVKRGCRQ